MGENTWKIGEAVEIPEEAIKIALENEISLSDRFYLLAKRSPFFLAGIVGLTTVCGIGAYKWKTRTVKPSIFIVQLRVAAQATALGIISLGMFYGMYNDYIKKKKKE
ncbi:HIG1 domain family member 1C-like [Bombus pyrosoma]|uniref:HIG1 domain family member 1C-like n=1 Tax=Bombus pyrosoma TaxID=396416 RepID=UPI001CB98275|nr:HIG1 domain family member 1C-like [Bombus pyrosoma]